MAHNTLIVGNLDCEVDYAGGPPLPSNVQERIAAAATTMRIFAKQGDALWIPHSFDTQRLPPILDNPCPRLCSGPIEQQAETEILAWGETEQIHAMRTRTVGNSSPGSASGDAPLQHWHLHLASIYPTATVARLCNQRALSYNLSAKLQVALPGAKMLDSVDSLQAHLHAGGANHGKEHQWVLKAPWSASGRDRLRRRGLDKPARTRAQRLFTRHGELVFEPWVDRICDFGCTGIVWSSGQTTLFPPHLLHNDAAGVFRGITIPANKADYWLCDKYREIFETTVHQVARQLAQLGYRGPFSVDGYTYRDPVGQELFQPLSEINARMSFGHVARAWWQRLATPNQTMEFHLSHGPTNAEEDVIPLLLPGKTDPTSAWLRCY